MLAQMTPSEFHELHRLTGKFREDLTAHMRFGLEHNIGVEHEVVETVADIADALEWIEVVTNAWEASNANAE
jgi:hypothetical protein